MLFILHIKGTVADVQDIVKYLPVMPGRQYLLIQLLSIHRFEYLSFDVSLPFPFWVPTSLFFVEKDIWSIMSSCSLFNPP